MRPANMFVCTLILWGCYISIQDNTEAHGPGSQQSHNKYEADCIIGTVIEGMEDGIVDRIHTMPGRGAFLFALR